MSKVIECGGTFNPDLKKIKSKTLILDYIHPSFLSTETKFRRYFWLVSLDLILENEVGFWFPFHFTK